MPETAPLQLVLFVRGNAARSLNAIRLVRQLAGARPTSAALRVVDVSQQPAMAARYRVVATPTLLRTGGGGERRVVGELSEQSVLDCLEAVNDGD